MSLIINDFFMLLLIILKLDSGGAIAQDDEIRSSDVRITVFEEELKCATCNLLGFTKILQSETKGTNVKVMHDAKYESKTTQLPFSYRNPCFRLSVTSVV